MSALLKSELRKLIYLRANWLLLLWSGLFAALGTVAPILVLNSDNGPGRGVFSGTETQEGINEIDRLSQKPIFDDFANDFVDFSESNPFGDLIP